MRLDKRIGKSNALLHAACSSTLPAAGCCGPRSRQAARRLVLRAFRATAPAELQGLLRDPPAAVTALAGHAAAGAGRQRFAPACSPGMRCGREDAGCVNAWADVCSAPPLRSPRQHQATMPVTARLFHSRHLTGLSRRFFHSYSDPLYRPYKRLSSCKV